MKAHNRPAKRKSWKHPRESVSERKVGRGRIAPQLRGRNPWGRWPHIIKKTLLRSKQRGEALTIVGINVFRQPTENGSKQTEKQPKIYKLLAIID